MHIDSYEFGKIVIGGKSYTADVIVTAEAVYDNWWRKEGHLLRTEDLDRIIEVKPEILVIGCGAYGMMSVDKGVRRCLEENSIRMEAYNTAEAVERYNELSVQGQKVAAALHLTC